MTLPPWLIATGLVLAAMGLNLVGVREASRVNIVFTLVEAAGLAAVIVVGAREPAFGEAFRAAPHAGVLAGAALIFFAYLGFEDIANLAEEAAHPARDLPRAIFIAVAVSTTLYVLVAAASVALVAPARLAESASPLADAMAAGAPALAGALGGVALFATANTALITITATSRLLFALARGGDAPAGLGRTLAMRRAPAAAIVLAGAGALAFLPLGGVGFLGSVASLLALLAFAAVNAALIRLRFTRPAEPRPFRVPLRVGRVPVATVLALLVVLVLLVQFERAAYGLAAAALAVAAVVRFFSRFAGALPARRSDGR